MEWMKFRYRKMLNIYILHIEKGEYGKEKNKIEMDEKKVSPLKYFITKKHTLEAAINSEPCEDTNAQSMTM